MNFPTTSNGCLREIGRLTREMATLYDRGELYKWLQLQKRLDEVKEHREKLKKHA